MKGFDAVRAQDKRCLVFLDSLRGLAAAYVVIYHMALIPQPHLQLPLWAETFTMMGGTGVTLFFIVSAFSLYYTMPLRQACSAPLKAFYLHRILRIAPLFYVMIVVTLLRDAWMLDVHHSIQGVMASVLFIFNFFPLRQEGFVWAGWTIGVEMVFYAIFPFMYARVRSLHAAISFVITMLLLWYAILAVLGLMTLPPGWRDSIEQWSAFRHFPIFAIGGVLYFWYTALDPTDPVREAKGAAALAAGVFTFLALIRGWLPNVLGTPYYLQGVAYGLMFAGLAQYPWPLLVNRGTAFLGKISYSLYLMHPPVVLLLVPVYRWVYSIQQPVTASFLTCVLMTYLVMLPLAWAGYRFIELPGIRLGKALEERWWRPALQAEGLKR